MSRSIPRTRPRPVDFQLPEGWGVNWFAYELTPLGAVWTAIYHDDDDADLTVGAAFERDGSMSGRFEQPRAGREWTAVKTGRPIPLADGGAVFVAAMIGAKTHYRWFQVDHTGKVVNERDLFVGAGNGRSSSTPYVHPLADRAKFLVTWDDETRMVDVASGAVFWKAAGRLYEGGENFLLFSDVRPTRGTVRRVADGSVHRELSLDGKGWLRVWSRFDKAVVNHDPLDEGYELEMPADFSSTPTKEIAVVVVDLETGREILRTPGRITGLDSQSPVLVVTEWTARGTVERHFLHDGTLLSEISREGPAFAGPICAADDIVVLRRTLDSLSCETPGSPPEQLWRMTIPRAKRESSRSITCVGGMLFLRDDYSQRISMFVEPSL